MKKRYLAWLPLMLLSAVANAGYFVERNSPESEESAKLELRDSNSVVSFCQPIWVITSRVPNWPESLNGFIGAIRAEFAKSEVSKADRRLAFEVIAVLAPNGRKKIWIVSSDKSLEDSARIIAGFDAVEAPPVTGPVGVAICFALNGQELRSKAGFSHSFPMPRPWREYALSRPNEEAIELLDGILGHVWPEYDKQ